MSHRAWIAACLLALVLPAVVASAQTAPGPRASPASVAAAPLEGARLLAALRRGGYVLYFRHTSTDFGQSDEAMTSYEDCRQQRNLTDAGRDEARAIGAALKRLRIPIGEVHASPFCRTMETAQLVFGRATADPVVRGGPAQAEAERYAPLRKLLATPVAPGSNVAIASHGNPFRAVAQGPYLAEGEAAVIEPLGAAGFRIVARIPRGVWRDLEGLPPQP